MNTMNNFTNDELHLISDALIAAIRANSEAAKMTISLDAVREIDICNKALSVLNSKVCSLL